MVQRIYFVQGETFDQQWSHFRFLIALINWLSFFRVFQSNNNDFHCWAPTEVPNNSSKVSDGFTKLATLDIQQCTYYWERFALNYAQSLVALGNDKGVVYIYDLTTDDPADIPFVTLTHPKCTQIIRQFSFSRCGRELVFCCEDGTIWHYQRQNDKNWSLNQRRHWLPVSKRESTFCWRWSNTKLDSNTVQTSAFEEIFLCQNEIIEN